MKSIIRCIFCAGVFLCYTLVFAEPQLTIYSGKRGDAIIISSEGHQSFMVAGGAVPNEAATSADCFVKADLKMVKAPNYFEGSLDPVKNEIIDVNSTDVAGRGLGIYILKDHIRVGGVQAGGICADDIDFSGIYKKINNRDTRYEPIFLYFMNLSNQGATYSSRSGNKKLAIRDLKPFIDNHPEKWRNRAEARKIIDAAEANYRSLTHD